MTNDFRLASDNPSTKPPSVGDVNGDGVVGINDFLDLLADWGACSQACCLADLDLDNDTFVGIIDFLILLGNWSF